MVRASGNEVFALLGRTGTGQCLVAVTGTALSHCPCFWRRPRPAPGAASNLAGTGLGGSGRHCRLSDRLHRRSTPVRPRLPVRLRRSLRLPARSPSASGQSAADAPGPPIHRVAPRGVRRCRRSASRLQSGTPAVCGRLPADPRSGRGGGHFPWLSLRRFRGVTGFSVVHLIGGHCGRHGPWCSRCFFSPPDLFQPPTYLEPCPSPRERPGNTRTGRLLARGRAPGRMGFRWNPLWPGVGIIAASFAAGTCCPGGERVALQSRGTLRWRSSVVTGSG